MTDASDDKSTTRGHINSGTISRYCMVDGLHEVEMTIVPCG